MYSGVTLLIIEHLRELRSAGKYQEIYDLYLQLVAARDTTAEICMLGGLAAKKLGNLEAARDGLESCLERGPEGTVLGIARFVLGMVLRQLGQLHDAIEVFTAFISSIDEYPDLKATTLGAAYYNRGLAYRQSNRLEESLRDYYLACDEFAKENLMEYLCMALHNLAWVASLFGDAIQTGQALQKARPLCATPYLRWHQRIGEAFLASIDYDPLDAQSRLRAKQNALDLCKAVYLYEGDDLPPEVRTQSYWLAGTISVDLGLTADAYYFARESIRHALVVPSPDNQSLPDAAALLHQVRMVPTRRVRASS